MEPELLFDEVYRSSMLWLKVIGAHPSMARDRKWLLRVILLYGYFFMIGAHFLYNLIFINIKENEFSNACSNGVFVVVLIVVSFKYGVMLWYQNKLQAVIKLQEKYFEISREFTAEEQDIVQNYIKKGQWISKLWFKSCFVTAAMFPLKSFLDSVYSAYLGEFKLYSFTENSYPFGIDNNKDRVDVYLVIYSTFFYYAFYAGSTYTGFAPLGPICIMNACGQIDIVIKRVNRLFVNGFKEESLKELKSIVQFLQETYSFVDDINAIFQVLYELCLKASALLIPISMYLLIENARERKLSLDYIMFVYTAFLLCFVPCAYSDKLKEKGEELHFAIYACGWEKFFDKSTRMTLYIMMIRASRPLCIRTVFRTVSLETFSELCKQSYVIFNMLYAVLE